MNRRTGLAIGVVGMSLIAGGLVAGALSTPVPPSQATGESPNRGGGGGFGPGGPPPLSGSPFTFTDMSWLGYVIRFALVLSVFLIVSYVAVYRREYLPHLIGGIVLAAVAFVSLELVTGSAIDVLALYERFVAPLFGGSGDPGDQLVSNRNMTVIGLVVLGVLVLSVIYGRSRLGHEGENQGADNDDPGTDSAEALAEAAGRAADRIESSATYQNEIYRAWKDMTDLLTVARRDTMTPQEFANTAIAVGMRPGDVTELTRLFEDVRYGDYRPTAEREHHARRVFRHIEETYRSPDQ